MTPRDVAWRIACEFDRADITDDELDHLLWEHTPFPVSSWSDTCARLRAWFTEHAAVA